MLHGRAREMGLGSLSSWSLAEARDAARKARQLISTGIDPIQQRDEHRSASKAAQLKRRSFEDCAREYHRLIAKRWKNEKHGAQWINTLSTYAFPVFGSKEISTVNKADVLAVLE